MAFLWEILDDHEISKFNGDVFEAEVKHCIRKNPKSSKVTVRFDLPSDQSPGMLPSKYSVFRTRYLLGVCVSTSTNEKCKRWYEGLTFSEIRNVTRKGFLDDSDKSCVDFVIGFEIDVNVDIAAVEDYIGEVNESMGVVKRWI